VTKGLFPLPQGVALRGGFGDSRRIRATIVASVDRLLGPVSITAASCVAWPAIVSGLCCVLVGANNGTVALRWVGLDPSAVRRAMPIEIIKCVQNRLPNATLKATPVLKHACTLLYAFT